MRQLLQLLWTAVLAVLCGCAGYQLGPTNGVRAGAKSIQLQPLENQTMEPRLGDVTTVALRRELQRDGTYSLATHGEAEVVCRAVLTHYDRHELSFLPNDVLTVKDFRVSVTAEVTARDRATGRVLVEQPVTAYTLVRVGSDLSSSERQALPILADELAKNITALLVDGTW